MGQGSDNDDDENRHDLTRIEDLSEFLHEEDPQLESILEDLQGQFNHTESAPLTEIDSLSEVNGDLEMEEEKDLPPLPTGLDEGLEETPEDIPPSFSDDEATFTNNDPFEAGEFNQTDLSTEMPLDDDQSSSEDESISFDDPPSFYQENSETESSFIDPPLAPEKFDEVKTFAQNFSYGQILGGGNPPFSLLLRNLIYHEDKEDIMTLLNEFGLINEANREDTHKALELGSLLIPQISEYSAIVLAHKLRRFDCDLEIGLSDEIHPSKNGEINPRGLIKKESLHQNKTEHFILGPEEIRLEDIIVSTTPSLVGYIIKKYIGVQTAFSIIDEEELERERYIQEHKRSSDPIPFPEMPLFEETQASSFAHLFLDLADQLKNKAVKERANAILGLSYQLTPLPFLKSDGSQKCYQLTCSATLAVVQIES
ncbi:MAG: hypothetical protein KBD76_00760 [Bacteriovorax sp.]|nr:hypothetical protein [Bacteriovorax sp.]